MHRADLWHPDDVTLPKSEGVAAVSLTEATAPAGQLWCDYGVSSFPVMHESGAPYGSMHETQCKEQFSIAYVHAITTAARCKLEVLRVDDEVVDATIRQDADHELYDGVCLDIQLKCTSQNVLKANHVTWRLEKKHYKRLASRRSYNKRILIILLVPQDFDSWLTQDEASLRMVKCAYWCNLQGAPEMTGGSTSVQVPRDNVFNVEQLLGILRRLGKDEEP